MTPNTSSSSADGTTEDSKQDQIGRLLTETFSARTYMTDWEYRWWNLKVILRHWRGIHTLIPNEEWWYEGETPRVKHKGMKCWRCEYWEP